MKRERPNIRLQRGRSDNARDDCWLAKSALCRQAERG